LKSSKCCEKHRPSWRWQQLGNTPKFFDTAHNKEGLSIVLTKKETYEKLHIVLGVVNDKDLNEILPLFPKRHLLFLQVTFLVA
jgi:dihydrofolate synthase/folylpolyglutamate synthase